MLTFNIETFPDRDRKSLSIRRSILSTQIEYKCEYTHASIFVTKYLQSLYKIHLFIHTLLKIVQLMTYQNNFYVSCYC